MEIARNNRQFNWQQKGWPAATVDRTALRGELAARGFSKDVRSEGVALMVLSVREDWNKPCR